MKDNKFVCAMCGGAFEKAVPDAEFSSDPTKSLLPTLMRCTGSRLPRKLRKRSRISGSGGW